MLQYYALAADTLRKAPKDAALDPRFHYLLAQALSDGDRAGAAKEMAEALKINPRKENMSGLGRPIKLIDGGKAVKELFA